VLKLDKVFDKFEFSQNDCPLLRPLNCQIDRELMLNTITSIEKFVECGDPVSDRAKIRQQICPELDKLRSKYFKLDNAMSELLSKVLLPSLYNRYSHPLA